MVDVGEKPCTKRTAIAGARVLLGAEAFARVAENSMAKGDVLTIAKIAGMSAAKQTPFLIPLCHSLALSSVSVSLSLNPAQYAVDIEAAAHTVDRTGVEMEAMVAASVAALTVYDMCKAVARGASVTDVRVLYKAGGKSGEYDARGDKQGSAGKA